MVKHQHKLPRDVMDAQSMETFKVRLEIAQSPDLGENVPAHCRGQMDQMTSEGHFQTKLFCDSMTL